MNSPKHGPTEAAWPELPLPYPSTMQVEDRKFVEIFVLVDFLHAGRPLVFPDVSHELGLQALSAELAADVQSAFALGNLVIPGTKIEHWPVEFDERSPHQPPVVGGALERPAIGAGAAIH